MKAKLPTSVAKLLRLRTILSGGAIGALLVGAVGYGYYAGKLELDPLHRLAYRIERKLGKIMGEPTETERLTARVETTFLQLRGTVYEIPGNDYVSGGALAVWGDDLIVLDHDGRMFQLEDGVGLKRLDIAPPPNGKADYAAAAASEKYAGYVHKVDKLRYNDLVYVEADGLRGLAISYTFFNSAEECYGSRVAWLPLDAGVSGPAGLKVAAEDWEVIFETAPCLELNPTWTALEGMMAGGRMAFKAPSTLYYGSGDYNLDGIHTYDAGIQSDETSFGKVLAIDLRDGGARIVSKGHRNLQGLALDAEGRLWTTEHAVRGGDELNLIREGANYGWPLETLGTLYSGQPAPTEGRYGRHELHEPPVYAWLPSAGISSLTAISGLDESWDGDLLAGSLSSADFGQSLFHIRVRDERVVFVERIALERRVRYVTQWGADRIAVWLDTNELVVFTAARRSDPLADLRAEIAGRYNAEMAARLSSVLNGCSECHSFEQYRDDGAPSLNGVVGREIAVTKFDGYSDVLKSRSGVWNAETLGAFLVDPASFAPGTVMPAPGLREGRLLDALIWALGQVDSEAGEHMTYDRQTGTE